MNIRNSRLERHCYHQSVIHSELPFGNPHPSEPNPNSPPGRYGTAACYRKLLSATSEASPLAPLHYQESILGLEFRSVYLSADEPVGIIQTSCYKGCVYQPSPWPGSTGWKMMSVFRLRGHLAALQLLGVGLKMIAKLFSVEPDISREKGHDGRSLGGSGWTLGKKYTQGGKHSTRRTCPGRR